MGEVWNAAYRALVDIGIDLQYGRQIPGSWKIMKTTQVGPYEIIYAVPPEYYSGYEKGKGQQTIGGFGTAGVNKFGIEIQVRTDEGDVGTDRVLENSPFDTQVEIYDQAIVALRELVNPPVQSVQQVGTVEGRSPLNSLGRPWRIGDVVNVSRPTGDGGGFTKGLITRIYPTTVQVTWNPDLQHAKPWTTEEKKQYLIFVYHDEEWETSLKSYISDSFVAEEIGNPFYEFENNPEEFPDAMRGKPPAWTELVGIITDPNSTIIDMSPLPFNQRVLPRSL